MNKSYESEARSRWGETQEYREHISKTKDYSSEKWSDVSEGLMAIFCEFSKCMDGGKKPDSEEAQTLVLKLQSYITENYYTCSNEILSGLGKMYIGDERFKSNIDKNKDGTAEFVAEAIAIKLNQR